MTRRTVVAVIGPGEGATALDRATARRVGELVAEAGWVTLTGGWNLGVMDAASRGARDAGGLTVGLLPGRDADGASPGVEIVIPTGLGEARNNLVVLASDALVCCGMSAGTASEAALTLRVGKPLVLVAPASETTTFLNSLHQGEAIAVPDAESAIVALKRLLELS